MLCACFSRYFNPSTSSTIEGSADSSVNTVVVENAMLCRHAGCDGHDIHILSGVKKRKETENRINQKSNRPNNSNKIKWSCLLAGGVQTHDNNDKSWAENSPGVRVWTYICCNLSMLSSNFYKQLCFCYFHLFSISFFVECWPPRGRGGGARQIVSSSFYFISFIFLFRFVCFVFVFSLVVSFCFTISQIVYVVPVAPSMMTWLCIANCGSYRTRGNVVSLWISFVTTELVSLLGLENRHGHCWLCGMSTGRKNGLM